METLNADNEQGDTFVPEFALFKQLKRRQFIFLNIYWTCFSDDQSLGTMASPCINANPPPQINAMEILSFCYR